MIGAIRGYLGNDGIPTQTVMLYGIPDDSLRRILNLPVSAPFPILHEIRDCGPSEATKWRGIIKDALPAIEAGIGCQLRRDLTYQLWAPEWDAARRQWDVPSSEVSIYHRDQAEQPDTHPADPNAPWYIMFGPWLSDTPMTHGFASLEAATDAALKLEDAHLHYRHSYLHELIHKYAAVRPLGVDCWLPDLRIAPETEPRRHYFRARWADADPQVCEACEEHGADLRRLGFVPGRGVFGWATQVAETCFFCEVRALPQNSRTPPRIRHGFTSRFGCD